MSRSRAYTRHQKRRALNRGKRRLDMQRRGVSILYTDEMTQKNIHLYAENRQPCSCGICRDPKYRDTRHKCGINTLLEEL